MDTHRALNIERLLGNATGDYVKTEIIQATAGAATLSAVTYIPIMARSELGADDFYITMLVASYAAASFFASYLFGRAGDIYGRRLILRVGLLTALVSFGLIWFAYTPEMLLVIRLFNGFSVGMYPGALAAYAYDSKMRMGRFASFGAVGWGFGTILAGYAAGFEVRLAFLVATLFFLVAFLSAMTLPTTQRTHMRVPLFPVETFRRNMSVYCAVLVRHSSASAIWTLWPLFLVYIGGDTLTIGIVQATNSLSQVVFMLGLADRFRSRNLIILGLAFSSLTFYWFTLASNIVEILPAQVLLGLSWSCLYVGALKYVTERNEERATATGLLQSMLAISGVLGPLIASGLITIWQGSLAYTAIMSFGAVMSILALALFMLTYREAAIPSIQTQPSITTKTSTEY
ncbi:MAG: MFS transporter [Candidatus Thorarchaeota archaeon]|nr:MFS transporter [Candidatus Thorarchaeota archaeon]